MTNITITRNEITSKGHAGLVDDDGIARLCCSISTLMYTLSEALCQKNVEVTTFVSDGYMRVKARPHDDAEQAKADSVFSTIASGLSCLAEQYPEYINLRKDSYYGNDN